MSNDSGNKSVDTRDNEYRPSNPTDYNRPTPTKEDWERIRHFLEAEDPTRINSQVERKLGLLIAGMFNKGWEAAMSKASKEDGFEEGYRHALRDVVNGLAELGKKKLVRR